MYSAARSSASPPISPLMTISSVSGSCSKSAMTSMKDEPGTGSPPMPTIEELPKPRWAISLPIWYVSVPERETTPTLPSLKNDAGMIPTLALPGESTPGQLGPIRRTPSRRCRCVKTRSSSWAGMPSVMAMIVSMPASAASRIESAANGGGTKTIAVFAPVSSTAAWKVLKTGMPSTDCPPLPGVTPETTLVP
jgi:hypothetical protein